MSMNSPQPVASSGFIQYLHHFLYIAGIHLTAVDVFEALEAGVDVFDGSYPTEMHSLNAANHICSRLHAQHAFCVY